MIISIENLFNDNSYNMRSDMVRLTAARLKVLKWEQSFWLANHNV